MSFNLGKRYINMENKIPDIEVIFEFNGARKIPVYDGYRPAHLIKEDYLTTGVHHYYDVETIPINGSGVGTITFITPEMYPACLWIGKKINIQEGGRVVGYATVTKIFNALLLRN
jgi:elongation factor Tu